jgi:hypothetical protein
LKVENAGFKKHGPSTEQFSVSAYAGSSKNLKDLKFQDVREQVSKLRVKG